MQYLLLVRLSSELTLKARRTRAQFMRQLVRNLKDAFASSGVAARVTEQWGRIYVRTESAAAIPVVGRVFGISSYSVVDRLVEATLPNIIEQGLEVFGERVTGKRFAVRAHRVGTHDFKSKDIELHLGGALRPLAARVDLSNPEVTAHVEVRNQDAYLYSDRVEANGGLPVAVEGRAVSLISGGYDSAVSSWLMLKRGIELDYVFCNLGGDAYERAVVQVAKLLADEWSYGTRPRLHVVDFDLPLRALCEHVRESYWQIVLKRLMYRAAAQVAQQWKAHAIITGEAVGQVSSQTLPNLRAIEPASSLPVFRPLLGFDKEEIIGRARLIGTAALSEQVKEYCAIAPGKPVTAASVERVNAEEARLDLGVVDQAVDQRKVIDLRALTNTDLAAAYLFTSEIPEGATIIDCRPEAHYNAWHLEGAEHREEWELLRDFKRLDKNRKYVLYCAHGIQTAYLAEKMQNAGFEAYSFKGGLRGVMNYAGVSR
jgi:tRNA uracil 4-sulfurtransferase